MMAVVDDTLEESDSPTPFNIRHHGAHYLYLKKEFAQWRAHHITPTKDARHCVMPGNVICHARRREFNELFCRGR